MEKLIKELQTIAEKTGITYEQALQTRLLFEQKRANDIKEKGLKKIDLMDAQSKERLEKVVEDFYNKYGAVPTEM